jgi:hypothetical protein
MTIEQLRKLHRARPFQPFTMHLADGRSVHVAHNDFLAQSPSGRTVVVYQPDETSEIIDLLLVVSLAVATPIPLPPPGNGQESQ